MNRKKFIIPISVITIIAFVIIVYFSLGLRYDKLMLSSSDFEKIISEKNENRNLRLLDIEFNDYNLIIDEKNSTLYYSLINTNSTKYNPKVTFKGINKDIKIAFLEDEITESKVKGNHEFKVLIYTPNEYRKYNLICTDLPLLNITFLEEKKESQRKVPMDIYLFNNLSKSQNRVIMSGGKIEILEDGYTFSLNMMTPGKNLRENRISILNMKPNSEYSLKKVEVENQIINNQQVKEKDSQILDLFINGEYQGVYELSHFKEKK